MSMSPRPVIVALTGLLSSVGCASDGAEQADTAASAQDTVTAEAAVDAVELDTEPALDTATPLTAAGYCEAMAEAYCGFYLRCDRMAVPDEATCATVFAEVCNAVYEPQYAALEARGLLRLDPGAVAICAEHLETVACGLQPGDLDGPCADMWQGQAPVGADCSYGIESLVCDETSTCVLDVDFCGTCQAAVEVGEACGGDAPRCHDDAACIGGECVARARPTEACSDALPCRVGASCVDAVCVSPAVVAVGQPCDQAHRCQYKAACVSGTCVETALLGEACSDAVPCADGRCEGGACVTTPTFSTGCLDP